ncbi:hypothetical protein DFH06DRAFT_1166714 [Mycena polygramma]|nr:hypothetical protein DFH06DRAFT_1166714 [Mycena polygramma]
MSSAFLGGFSAWSASVCLMFVIHLSPGHPRMLYSTWTSSSSYPTRIISALGELFDAVELCYRNRVSSASRYQAGNFYPQSRGHRALFVLANDLPRAHGQPGAHGALNSRRVAVLAKFRKLTLEFIRARSALFLYDIQRLIAKSSELDLGTPFQTTQKNVFLNTGTVSGRPTQSDRPQALPQSLQQEASKTFASTSRKTGMYTFSPRVFSIVILSLFAGPHQVSPRGLCGETK